MSEALPWYAPFKNAWRLGCCFVAHALSAGVLIGAMALLSWLLSLDGEPRLYGIVPLKYTFDTIEVCIFVVFVVHSVRKTIRIISE